MERVDCFEKNTCAFKTIGYDTWVNGIRYRVIGADAYVRSAIGDITFEGVRGDTLYVLASIHRPDVIAPLRECQTCYTKDELVFAER